MKEIHDAIVDYFLSQENIKTAEEEFAKIGVQLRNEKGEFRSMQDILSECAEVWNRIK